MKWPLEFTDQIVVKNKDSNVAIITLWTKKEKILEKLTSDYAIVGQLYSADEGVNALLRNLLANKAITNLIIIGADLSKSGQSLSKFFENGINKNHQIIGLENITIDKEIPIEVIDELRKNVKFHDLREIKDFLKLNSFISSLGKSKSWGKPDIFPKKEITPPQTYPSEKAGFIIRSNNIDNAWIQVLDYVINFGIIKKSQYSEDQKEIIALTTIIEDEDPDNPKITHCFDFNKEDLENYYPQVLSANKIDGVEYTYGQRLRNYKGVDQIEKIISKLQKTTYTRRAIAFTWNVETDYDNDKAPCLNIVHCIIQEGKLFMTAYFRSNDMYNAWPKNAFALRKLQKLIADEVGVTLGPLITISNSAHIYKSSWKKAKAVIDNFKIPPKRIGDPRGNLIIRVQDSEIYVLRESPDGKRLSEIKGKTAFELYPKLVELVSEKSHAFYLGTELQKAEIAIKEGKKYVQDQ